MESSLLGNNGTRYVTNANRVTLVYCYELSKAAFVKMFVFNIMSGTMFLFLPALNFMLKVVIDMALDLFNKYLEYTTFLK